MATLTSLGIGTGTDLNSIVSQLVAIERRPLQDMQRSASRLQTQVSSMGRVQSLFSALQEASNSLTNPSLWSQSSASSSNADAVSTVGGATAAAGNFSVNVLALANSQSVVTGASFAAATLPVGSGTLTMQVGSWDSPPTAFNPKGGTTAISVTVLATDTMQSLRDKINAASAGVTASIVSDASGVRLALRSSSTGAENGFRITAADDDGNNTDASGLSNFAYNPPGGTVGTLLKQTASDARANVNGIDVVSASNELTGTIEGLTLRLRQVTTAPVDIAVSSDRDAISKSITTFASAYSALAAYIADQTKYDAATRVGGVLQGDASVTALQGRLREVLNSPSGASSAFARMSDIGLQLQRDGSLTVNSTKLTAALGNLPELKKAFSNTDAATPGNEGFARRYQTLAKQALGVDGTVTTRTEGLRKEITSNGEKQTRLNERVDRFQQRLVAQYSAMDVRQSRLAGLNSFVTAQLAAMNRPSNG